MAINVLRYEHEAKLKKFLEHNHIEAEHLSFEQSCHSVSEAAQAAAARIEDFVKNICLVDSQGNLIVAIVKGEDKVDTALVAKYLNLTFVRIATAGEILKKTGYPCGGTPSFSFAAKFLIDDKVMEMQMVLSGGGSEYALVKISSYELQKANGGEVTRIRK